MIQSVISVVGQDRTADDCAWAPTGITETTIRSIIAVELTDMDSDELCERSRLLRKRADEVIAWSRENVQWAGDARERARRYRAEAADGGVDLVITGAGWPQIATDPENS